MPHAATPLHGVSPRQPNLGRERLPCLIDNATDVTAHDIESDKDPAFHVIECRLINKIYDEYNLSAWHTSLR
jgi:hypothetical protein